VQLVTIGMLPSGFIRAQSVKAMYWTVAFAHVLLNYHMDLLRFDRK
jgi:hypothetical protein